MSCAVVQAELGRSAAALRSLDRAETLVESDESPRVRSQRTLVLFHRGELRRAELEATDGLRDVKLLQDDFGVLRQLVNRSIVRLNAGQLAGALADLDEAEPIARRLNQQLALATIDHNAAVGHARSGNIPAAIDRFGRARGGYAALGSPARVSLVLATDEAESLLHAGLRAEAIRAARLAVDLAQRADHPVAYGEALALLSQCYAAADIHESAHDSALQARQVFARAGSQPWVLICDQLACEAMLARGVIPDAPLVSDLARRLAAEGWHWESVRLTLLNRRARLLQAPLDDGALNDQVLQRSLRNAPVALRVLAAEVRARIAVVQGRWGHALRIVDGALRELETTDAVFWSVDLRAGFFRRGEGLADLALQIAIRQGDMERIEHWAARWRSPSLAFAPALDRPELGESMARLRRAEVEARHSNASAKSIPARRELIEAERLAALAVRTSIGAATSGSSFGDTGDVEPGHPATIEFLTVGGRIFLLTRLDGSAEIRDCGEAAAVVAAIEQVVASLVRACQTGRARHRSDVARVAAGLDAELLNGIPSPLPDDLTIVPSGPLWRMPWACLPTFFERALTVVPSRRMLRVRHPLASSTEHCVVVAGPRLRHAGRECDAIARLYPPESATLLVGRDASVEKVLSLLEGTHILHIAAHGRFRTDNPGFSGISLVDGELHLYDLLQQSRTPDLVVLSSCHAARSQQVGSVDAVGLVSQLLLHGTRNVVAPLDVVSDSATCRLMEGLHRELVAGSSSARALQRVRAGSSNGVREWASVRMFQNYGPL